MTWCSDHSFVMDGGHSYLVDGRQLPGVQTTALLRTEYDDTVTVVTWRSESDHGFVKDGRTTTRTWPSDHGFVKDGRMTTSTWRSHRRLC